MWAGLLDWINLDDGIEIALTTELLREANEKRREDGGLNSPSMSSSSIDSCERKKKKTVRIVENKLFLLFDNKFETWRNKIKDDQLARMV